MPLGGRKTPQKGGRRATAAANGDVAVIRTKVTRILIVSSFVEYTGIDGGKQGEVPEPRGQQRK